MKVRATLFVMLLGLTPVPHAARAVSFNNLSAQNTSGLIRLHPVFQDRTSATVDQAGDPAIAASNPNRTVGDFPFDPDFRTLIPNPAAGDGHSHYHTGATTIFVNDVTGFRAGDTVLVGSTNCNVPLLGLTCEKGAIHEQPIGEVAHVIGGDVAPGDSGPGALILAEPLSKDNSADPLSACSGYATCSHEQGEQVVKLQTGYAGQQFQIVVRATDACGSAAGSVNISAGFVPPQGAHDPAYPQRALTVERTSTQTVRGLVCPPAPGAGPVTFFVPHELTRVATVGRTFDVHSPDDWYTVVVTATLGPTVVSDGVLRFKLNPVAMTSLSTDRATYVPLEAATIAGSLRDASSAPALERPVEDVIVDVAVTNPLGLVHIIPTTSCVDTDPTAFDNCGTHHGDFAARAGGLVLCCTPDAILTGTETVLPGTYYVNAAARGVTPAVEAFTTFDVAIL